MQRSCDNRVILKLQYYTRVTDDDRLTDDRQMTYYDNSRT